MKRARDICVAVVLSPETAVIVGTIVIYLWLEPALARLGSRVEAGPPAIQWLALLPALLLGVAVREHSEILSPSGPNADAYQRWPGYQRVKDRYFITLGYLLCCTVITVGLWALGVDFAKPEQFCLFFGSIALSATTFALLFLAKITLKRLLATAE